MKKSFITTIVFVLMCTICSISATAQTVYTVDARIAPAQLKSGHLRMGDRGPSGKALTVNNRYLMLNGQPVIPVMGEVHYSRIPRAQWEDVILKMKANGVNIIACYVLWMHHEQIEGQFDWTDNKDLRAFLQLCKKHGLWAYPRIGPWCHAEVRNGATPDWILLKKNIKDRTNDPVYQSYAARLYSQIALQIKGLLYKDGGPVIGVQLENEYSRGKGGEEHILWLKQTAIKYGIDVPMYTVTGWQNGSVPPLEVIPLWGAYPDEPWAGNLNRSTGCENFRFTPFRDDEKIGNDLTKAKEKYIDNSLYPFFTCETGLGIENTDHRRLQIGAKDGLGLMLAKIGSGSNLPGYYMFAGGSNPLGIFNTLEENKEETGYWNTNPVISYDFQAAIRESGQTGPAYHEVKQLHYFLNEFGNRLAPMEAVFPAITNELQYAVRVKDNAAFLFGINYCRHNTADTKNNIQFSIQLPGETVVFPEKPVSIPDSSLFIWPVNFDMDGTLLKYATAQPLCKLENNWVFIQDIKAFPEFGISAADVVKLETTSGKVSQKNGLYIINGIKPDAGSVITIQTKKGIQQRIIILSLAEAKKAWLLNNKGRKYFFISDADLYIREDKLHMASVSHQFTIQSLGTDAVLAGATNKQEGLFTVSTFNVAKKELPLSTSLLNPMAGAQWLRTGIAEKITSKTTLFQRFFVKEFSLRNPADIKSAAMLLASSADATSRLQLNNLWVNQDIIAGKLNVLDITGYVKNGENTLMLAFPYTEGSKAFAATIIVEYFNSDKIVFSTDGSWVTKDAYNYPSYLKVAGGYKAPEIVGADSSVIVSFDKYKLYRLTFPDNYLAGLNNVYLQINYTGDKARLRLDHRLIADDFNSGAIWTTGLNRLSNLNAGNTMLEITPLSPGAKVYFDDTAARQAATEAALRAVKLVPEYSIEATLLK